MEDFAALYERCFPAVWAYAVSRVGRQAAEDVVSETFAIAWRRRPDIPIGADAIPWLLAVARNVTRQNLRADVRRRLIDAEVVNQGSESAATEDIADAVVDRTQVLAALGSLTAADQEVLILVAWHGLSPTQLAEALGCARATSFVRLHRARRRLERAMSAEAPTTASRSARTVPTEVST